MEKQDFFDVADGEAAVLELSHEAEALQDAGVVESMTTLGPSRFAEQPRSFVKTNRIARNATADSHISDS